mmetsp:Transcript_73075/g.201671  ORF Transcript_73075/g.201671 Transcript_73075/m.201671 type:complete len:215 (-) Transcript_73075:162-806(-)
MVPRMRSWPRRPNWQGGNSTARRVSSSSPAGVRLCALAGQQAQHALVRAALVLLLRELGGCLAGGVLLRGRRARLEQHANNALVAKLGCAVEGVGRGCSEGLAAVDLWGGGVREAVALVELFECLPLFALVSRLARFILAPRLLLPLLLALCLQLGPRQLLLGPCVNLRRLTPCPCPRFLQPPLLLELGMLLSHGGRAPQERHDVLQVHQHPGH